MIVVYDVQVDKTLSDKHRIAWSAKRALSSPTEVVDDYLFKVLWSEDPETGFVVVTDANGVEVIIDGAVGPLYIEHYLKHTPHSRESYYRIRAIQKIDPTVYKDSCTYYDGDASDGVLKSIVYAERMLNRHFIGEPVYIKKRKTDGGRCPQCWNPYQFKRTKTHCPTCRGTGFFDGFYEAIEAQVSFERNPKIVEVGQVGEIQVTSIKARMSHFPLVTPRDLVVGKDNNERYTITRVDYTKLPNLSQRRGDVSSDAYIVSQMLSLSELPPDDDKYSVIIEGQDIRSIYDESGLRMPHRNIHVTLNQLYNFKLRSSGIGEVL